MVPKRAYRKNKTDISQVTINLLLLLLFIMVLVRLTVDLPSEDPYAPRMDTPYSIYIGGVAY